MQTQRIPLDELMVAMDAVDELRHQDKVVEDELNAKDRRDRLIAKLKQIYEKQGISVSDEMLEAGVDALEKDRFTYKRGKDGLGRSFALLYVKRAKWLKPMLAGVSTAILLWVGYFAFVQYPKSAQIKSMPKKIHKIYASVISISSDKSAKQRANLLLQEAKDALNSQDIQSAKRKAKELEELLSRVKSRYTVRIVQEPNERSGIWRRPPHNSTAKNYYLIVEAVDDNENIVPLKIKNEEDSKIYSVKRWALRVDRDTYERVRSDKLDDGIVQGAIVGKKERGKLNASYSIPTTGESITKW